MAKEQMAREEKSLGDLFTDLASNTGKLVRQEVALAQTELTNQATTAGKIVGFLAVGGLVGYAALLGVLAAVILLLGNYMPVWLSALVVSLVVGIAAAFLIMSAIKGLKNMDPVPRETIETLQEDATWLKKEVM
jgi:uncharacterized membrane protein YqjE